ncbi:MAG: copper homeostasis protein CutC [Balneolaceae bacterium]|nr:MAG: copper homeostasis protein CutC [Balneolaceae bacterium]
MSDKLILEVPVFTAEGALIATKEGADRLELCSSFAEGGETPGAGLLSSLKQKVDIPIFPMIRPRGGDFVYSSFELDVMQEEIRILSSHGADGFVFGVLNEDGTVYEDACRRLVEAAADKPCTFHRAFDQTRDPHQAMETIIRCGFKRILTSGTKQSVGEGIDILNALMERAADRIIIMPGGGMKPDYIKVLGRNGWLKEVHASCKSVRPAGSEYRNRDVELKTGTLPEGVLTTDPLQIQAFKNIY